MRRRIREKEKQILLIYNNHTEPDDPHRVRERGNAEKTERVRNIDN